MIDISTPYVKFQKKITKDGYKLICIPYAGGGASFYNGWQKYFQNIEVIPIQLPGRENRMGEEFLLDCKEIAHKIVEEIAPYLDNENFSIFGHSMGGIIAFETAKLFEKLGVKPDVCFISSTSLTDKGDFIPSRELDDQQFFRRVSDFGGIDENSEILKYPEFQSVFLKILRADFEVIESYHNDQVKLQCPIVAYCGDEDPMENIAQMESWSKYTSSVVYKEYEGGHFYLVDHCQQVCKNIENNIIQVKEKKRYEKMNKNMTIQHGEKIYTANEFYKMVSGYIAEYSSYGSGTRVFINLKNPVEYMAATIAMFNLDFDVSLDKQMAEIVIETEVRNTNIEQLRIGKWKGSVVISNQKIRIENLKKWFEFQKKVVKNVQKVSITASTEFMQSMLWMLAIDMDVNIFICEELTFQDATLCMLNDLKNLEQKVESGQYLITAGCDALDFDMLRKKIKTTTRWINYYGFPFLSCVSYSKKRFLHGKEGYFHQLKPISETQIMVVNKEKVLQPINVSGRLLQKIENWESELDVCATISDENCILVEKLGESLYYIDGKWMDPKSVYEMFMNLDFIYDAYITEKCFYYTLSEPYSSFEVKQQIKKQLGDIVEQFEFIELPFIPKLKDGQVDSKKIEKFIGKTREEIKCLEKALVEKEVYIDLTYENIGQSIAENKKIFEKEEVNDQQELSAETAFLSMPQFDESLRKFNNMSQMIEIRGQSKQEILYINIDGEERQTYQELYKASRRVASGLQRYGVKAGDIIIFQNENNREYLTCFWACILIGAVVAPLGVLDDYGTRNINNEKLKNICEMIPDYYILASDKVGKKLENLIEKNRLITYSEVSAFEDTGFDNYIWEEDQTAMMLFTSGSTGIPKGVCLSQKNVFARTISEVQRYDMDETLVDMNWMTLTHAAGIIWSHIRDVYLNAFQIQVMSEVVLNEPIKFLDIINKYRVTTTWTPNFEFTLIRDQYDESKQYMWNLSCIKHIFVGGEANVSKDLRGFIQIGMRYGMDEHVVIPAFGMAETSSAFMYYDKFSLKNSSDEDRFVPIGSPNYGHIVRITDENGKVKKKGQIGRIECSGDVVTKGYYKNEKANKESFTEDGFLITGDIGYIKDDYVVLTGRLKEVIIINGLNYYVQDIESIVNEIEGVIPSYTIASSVKNKAGTEDILLLFSPTDESVFNEDERLREITNHVRKEILNKSGLYVKYVIPELKEQSMRTEIGKKQRSKYRNLFYQGKYDTILQRIGILKDDNYIMQEVWREEIYQGNNTVAKIEKEEQDIVFLEENTIIDLYPLKQSTANLEEFLDGLYERCRLWNRLPDYNKIIVPTIHAIFLKGDQEFNSQMSLVYGLLQSCQQEHPEKKYVQVDMDVYDQQNLLREAKRNNKQGVCVYRQGRRYMKEFQTITKDFSEGKKVDLQKKNVLVVGGMGGIGKILCEHLGKKYNCTLLIVGRSNLDAENKEWISKINNLGITVEYTQADATKETEILQAMQCFQEKTGNKIDLIFNLAGQLGDKNQKEFWNDKLARTIDYEKKDSFLQTITSKFVTTQTLKKVAEQEGNIALILFGSVNGILGGYGLGAYSAANGFQNQYTNYINQVTKIPVYCLNWSGWYKTGLSKDIPEVMVKLSQKSGSQFANEEDNLLYFDMVFENGIQNVILGLERNFEKNKCMTNDLYKPLISIYSAADIDEIREIVSKEQLRNNVRYIQLEHIPYNSVNAKDVDIKQIRKKESIEKENSELLTENQRKMMEIWKSVLHLNQISLDDDFFELGGNSLLITKLVYEIEKSFGSKINMQDILVKGTIRELVSAFEGVVVTKEEMMKKNEKIIEEDIKIDFNIKQLLAKTEVSKQNAIFITGAAGFIGSFIMNEIVKNYPNHDIYCVVRKRDGVDTKRRFEAVLEKYQHNEARQSPKIYVIEGDISEPQFGMKQEMYDKLCKEVGIVYHCAAKVNFAENYAGHRKDNIVATKRILEFCCTKVKKELNYISSGAVFGNVNGEDTPIVYENTELLLTSSEDMSYLESKLVAEAIIDLGKKAGLNCRIFRMGTAMGDSVNGAIQPQDFFWSLVKSILKTKKIPNIAHYVHDFMPVDYMALQVLALAKLPYNPDDYKFHVDGLRVDFSLASKWILSRFPDIEITDYEEWIHDVKEYAVLNHDETIDSIIGIVMDEDTMKHEFTSINSDHTIEILKKHGVPIFNDITHMLNVTYEYLNTQKYFE